MTEPCEAYTARVDALVDEELAGDQVRQVQDHAAECPACAAYVAEATRLRNGLARLDLMRESASIADAVLAGIHRRILIRNTLLVLGLILLKVLDLCGLFGSGLLPRLVVTGAVLAAFFVLRLNPFRLIHTIEPAPHGPALPLNGGVS